MNLRKSILATLAYHDIFDYPLEFEELCRLLITNKSNILTIKRNVNTLVNLKKVGSREDFFYLKDRQKLIQIRKKRINLSKNKYKKAKFYLSLLKLIPSVKLAAITGALAMNNSTKNDDIDFLIISTKNTLWTTRFFSNLILLPYKRRPKSKKQKDKACLNIFIDESELKIKEQNMYTAHEIAQIKPMLDRGNTYAKFIKANSWLYQYLPNWKQEVSGSEPSTIKKKKKKNKSIGTNNLLIENFLKFFQLKYMKSKITTEQIGVKQLFFHPLPTQNVILSKYKNKIKNL